MPNLPSLTTIASLNDPNTLRRVLRHAGLAGLHTHAEAAEARLVQLGYPVTATRTTGRTRMSSARSLKTHAVAELALELLIKDYKADRPPTTYGVLVERCGEKPARWSGQVTDLIDAACAEAGVPSFALVRVREVSGDINDAAWRKGPYRHLRDRIVARALTGTWSDEDFTKIRDALADFAARGFGNKRAWDYVFERINMGVWAE